jgi:hypothetical protein
MMEDWDRGNIGLSLRIFRGIIGENRPKTREFGCYYREAFSNVISFCYKQSKFLTFPLNIDVSCVDYLRIYSLRKQLP